MKAERPPCISFNAHYIGRNGAGAKCSYGNKGSRLGCWHWEAVAGRTFGLAILESGYVMLREIGGICAEVGCAVPVNQFWKVFSELSKPVGERP